MTRKADPNSPNLHCQYSTLKLRAKEHYVSDWHDDLTLNTRLSACHRLGFRILGRFYCLLLGTRIVAACLQCEYWIERLHNYIMPKAG